MSSPTSEGDFPVLIGGLLNPEAYPHPVGDVLVAETHISWVLLAGEFAYKIKKPVNLGFLDFSTLQQRHWNCQEECRLNRRYAPTLYLGVVPVTGTPAAPRLNGVGKAIEYAVKMVRFDQDLLLSHLVQTGALRAETIDQLAEFLADFHGRVEQATAIDRHGLAELAAEASEANFRYLATTLEDPAERAELEALRDWSQRRYLAIETELRNRKRNGFVRECHGDLHLDNIVLIEDRPILFDGIEFNAQLRWIDVINELAFPVMDLEANGAPGHAYRLLNRYLELTGDYRGLILFDFFRLYRAMVRAKVALITETTRVSELDRPPPHGVCHRYLAYGSALIQRASPYLVLMHGYSGSGKSFVSQQLSQVLPAIRLRSDVERKRLAGLTAETRSRDDLAKSLYGPEMSAKTYAQLAAFAQLLLTVGHSVIVDATFLDHRQRAAFHGIAHSLGLGFAVVDCRATPEVLAARLTARNRSGRDPSDADLSVLAQQMEFAEPLSNSEMPWVVAVDTTTQLSAIDLAKAIAKIPQPL